jgi:hypothetical protein
MSSPQPPSNVKFHYVKSNFFRVIHSEGVIGGLTPSREIFLSFFNQRAALPRMIEFAISPEGKLGNELKREGKEGIVREMEVGVLMNVAAAKDLAEFLLSQVKLLEESEPEKKHNESVSTKRD